MCGRDLSCSFKLQAQLTQKGQELAQQTEVVAVLTSQHDQLAAQSQTQSTTLQGVQEELKARAAQVHDLVAEMAGQHKQLQSSQHQLQQHKDACSKLELQLGTQTAELGVAAEQANTLEADKQQLQQRLETMALDQHQMQSRLEAQKAEADMQLSASHIAIRELQV